MTRAGLLRTISLPTTIPSIRDNRLRYRVVNAGVQDENHIASLPAARILATIQTLSDTEGGWADEDEIWRIAFTGFSDRHAVRHRLKNLVRAGHLIIRPYPAADVTEVFTIRPRAIEKLNRSRARHGLDPIVGARTPRVDQIGHHLLTVQAAVLILNSTGSTIVRFQGDEDLRSETRRGRRMRAGRSDESLPDGRLIFFHNEQGERVADIEILTSKYSDAVLLKKHEQLQEGTIFAATTERLAARTEELTGLRPLVLIP